MAGSTLTYVEPVEYSPAPKPVAAGNAAVRYVGPLLDYPMKAISGVLVLLVTPDVAFSV